MKNMTNTNPSNATNNATVNFRAPINVKMPVNVKVPITFRAPVTVNLTYNNSKSEEKVTASDLQRYIAEATKGQCETVPEGWPAPIVPASKKNSCSVPAPKNSDCTPTDKPIRDRTEREQERFCVSEPIEDRIKREVGKKLPDGAAGVISVVKVPTAGYEMFAVGTRHDISFMVWKQQNGNLIVQKQTW